MDTYEWHARFVQQSQWTLAARSYLIDAFQLPQDPAVLEMGSGTGAILEQMAPITRASPTGLDLDWAGLSFNKAKSPGQKLLQADAYHAPVKSGSFDLVYCHYLMLWLQDPISALYEMRRLVKDGGWVCCFAEPDYTARIDSPDLAKEFGRKQNQGLARQGVRLDTGRHLASWMKAAGLSNIHWGILGAQQPYERSADDIRREWKMMKYDLQYILPATQLTQLDEEYRTGQQGSDQITFIPTFYAYAQK